MGGGGTVRICVREFARGEGLRLRVRWTAVTMVAISHTSTWEIVMGEAAAESWCRSEGACTFTSVNINYNIRAYPLHYFVCGTRACNIIVIAHGGSKEWQNVYKSVGELV